MSVAFGYTGSLIGFGVATLLQNMGYSYIEIFKSVAILFLLFSLPAFFFIEEKITTDKKIKINILNSLSIVINPWKHTLDSMKVLLDF